MNVGQVMINESRLAQALCELDLWTLLMIVGVTYIHIEYVIFYYPGITCIGKCIQLYTYLDVAECQWHAGYPASMATCFSYATCAIVRGRK